MKRILTIIILLAVGCSEDETKLQTIEPPVFTVPEEIKTHVDKFFEEASLRGQTIAKENLTIELVNSLPELECRGTGNQFGKSSERTIQINRDILDLLPLNQEFHIFRELAHVMLGHPYTPSYSHIMNPCNGTAYLEGDRDGVLDELFDEGYETPPTEMEATEDHYSAIDMVYEDLADAGVQLDRIDPTIKFTYNFLEECEDSYLRSRSSEDTIEIDMDLFDENGFNISPMIFREILHLSGYEYSDEEFLVDEESGEEYVNIMYKCNDSHPSQGDIQFFFR